MDIKKFFESIIPFIITGIVIALGIALLFMFFSVAIWGVVIGGFLWLGAMAKNYFFPQNASSIKKEDGRIIEHDKNK